MVLVGQGVGHHTDQLLPGSLAVRSEVLAEVGGQDDDQGVPQELQGREKRPSAGAAPASLPTTPSGPLGSSQQSRERVDLRFISDLSQVYLRLISDLSQVDPRFISDLSQVDLRLMSGLS